MELVRQLKDIRQADSASAGGKGANLGGLARMGLPVPPGFVLLTSAYQCFVEANKLQEEIERQIGLVSPAEAASTEQASRAIRALFNQGCIPADVVQAVLAAYELLGEPAVAVRSSATAEDLPGASFAGQQETYLNVQGLDKLLEAIKHCWSSLWTARAIDYRARQAMHPGPLSLAVVVQQMVSASAAGVLFTANPVTGAGDEVVINAAWGLGEAIVGGQVTPDMLIIEKATGRVKQLEIADKLVMTIAAANGTVERAVEPVLRQEAVLAPEQIARLTALGREIEMHFNAPQDIEWAIVGERVFLLQSRPVTTLSPVQAASGREEHIAPGDDSWDRENYLPPQPFDIWTRANVGENLPFPITPLTSTNFPMLFKLDETPQQQKAPTFQATRRLYGRLYFNEGAMIHNITEEFGIPASFMDRMWGSRRHGNQQRGERLRPLRLLRKLPSLLRQGFATSKQKGPKHTAEEFFAQVDQWVNPFMQQDLSLLDDRALWAEGLPIWRERGGYAFSTNLRISVPSGFMYALLERVVKWWTGRKELAHDLVISLPGIYSAEVGPLLWQMTHTLRESGMQAVLLDNSPTEALKLLHDMPTAQPFLEQLEKFLQRHGHRCPNELELLNPRWAEAPAQVIELLANYLQAGESINPSAAEKRQRKLRTNTVAAIEAKLDPLRRAIFRSLLKKAQRAITVRDNSRYYMTKFIFPMRKLYADLGRRWAERGWLHQADDIFFLTVAELRAIIQGDASLLSPQDLQARVTQRRIAYEYWLTVLPPDAIGPDGKPIVEEVKDAHVLEGVAASGGRVRGRARIVLDVHEAMRLSSGDILVAQATDPGWTPVFPLVSGIVLEIGGQLSHGAIVAREYGVPAVVNVRGALHSIKDGQIIVVDGTSGRVYLDEGIAA